MKYLIDSNIIIYHLNGNEEATNFITKNVEKSTISRITYIEVMSFNFTAEEEERVKDQLMDYDIIDTSQKIALQAIANRKEKKIKVPDNIIASTAQVNDLTLVTRNVNDFNNLDIKILNIIDQ